MSPYERALTDPVFLVAVAERWHGRGEVLQALRGLDGEPGTTYASLDARRVALYQPGTGQADRAEVARLLAERDELRAAVAAALVEAAERSAPAPALAPATERAGPPRRRRRAWPVLLLALPIAALAFGAGLLLGPALGSTVKPLPSIAPAQVPEPVVVKPAGADALAIFDRRRQASDRPIVAPEGDLVSSSFRRLVSLPGAGVELFAARTDGTQVCLVAVTVDAHLTASCTEPADFRGTPCTLDLSVTKDPATDDPKDTRTEIEATWSFDGTVRAGAVS